MKKLLIDVKQNKLAWALKLEGAVVTSGTVEDWDAMRAKQKEHGVTEVVIDEGYRTPEVRAACLLWGWRAVKGRTGSSIANEARAMERRRHELERENADAAEIEAATAAL